MRGSITDLLIFNPFVANLTDTPVNRYVFQPVLTMPWLPLVQSTTQGAELANAREVPFKVANLAQPPQTFMQNHDNGVFNTGGLAVVPVAGIWRVVK
jgi:hypothetical protein